MIRKPYDSMARAFQKDEENEAPFADRVRKAARMYRHVITKREVVNRYIQRFKLSVRESIREGVRLITEAEKRSLAVVRLAEV